MIPSDFQFHVATSLDEALRLLGELEDVKILAGGHSLLPMMKLRFAEPLHLIDLNGIEELKGIRLESKTLIIGAMTTENDLIRSELLQQHCPLIVEMAMHIADPQVRNRGTIGGDVVHGDPGNDHPAGMMALDAQLVLQSSEGERCVPANGFFMGTYWTGLDENEILTSIRIPIPPSTGWGHGFNKLKRKTGDFAVAASVVIVSLQSGVIEEIRIALTNVAPMAIRAVAAEQMLRGQRVSDELLIKAAKAVADCCDPVDSLSGDIAYKTAMAQEMTRRSLQDALSLAGGQS